MASKTENKGKNTLLFSRFSQQIKGHYQERIKSNIHFFNVKL